jgi:group I intron endonuclease
MKAMIIYKATCLITNKIYIGKTVSTLERRKCEHLSGVKLHSYNSAFHSAIRKYGVENFVWEVIDQCLFSESLIELEKYYIKKFNCISPRGMNLTVGGDGTCGRKCLEGTKIKIGNANRGTVRSEETKIKMSVSRKGKRCGEENPMFGKLGKESAFFGKHHSDETKKILSEKRKKRFENKKNA